MPGLAHFCEHLLFMGTRAFPSETEYKHYINSHGGSSNAYTSTTDTCYHFSVGSAHLRGAIERFAGFFHSPLFDPSCTLRELNAVDSEHRKNALSDVYRIWQLFKDLSVPGHPFGKFGTGNAATITQAARDLESSKEESNSVPASKEGDEKDGGFVARETRRRLIEWWEKHYCASIMSLAIIGRESLDDLTMLVLHHFSAVPNRGLTLPKYDRPWGPEQCGKLVLAKTVMDTPTMEMEFPISEQEVHYRSKPTVYLSHFIGHEGVGSLHSYLKRKGWLTRLWSGRQATGRGFGFFKINIRLTKSGLGECIHMALHSY
jgi:insulysin